ncbi:hypothetical protein SLEP1_g14588 [Rubroshorea leprosula]|uniref:B box-type domain-containing protein n=1 Tax=Rubroshorea leprosula TaxID=152421 RepID=A0AAV5IV14_9ROSI|nr:hypothetical protein SLEP1_g14588 [Rubroshorea leprosula]
MKIQCDVCNKAEASVFCTADDAALCDACDHRVHHANKLASKHQRFSLLHPSSTKQFPLCDVCQEKRAILFCQQDRAILCRDCDVPIHTANEHTQKHNRFLLTGVKLSATATVYTPSPGDSVTDYNSEPINKKPVPVSLAISNTSPVTKTSTVTAAENAAGDNQLAISEYLMEVLPGWHVEDFLDSSSALPFGFCKSNDGMLPFLDKSNMVTFSSESSSIWVPQTPSPKMYPLQYSPQLGGQIGFTETKEIAGMKSNRRWTDDVFTVPQINPSSKRSRLLW